MSVGHIARLLEDAGIPTVIVAADPFRDRLAAMSVPRLLVTPHPMGRPLGPPGNAARQREIVAAALDLLERATENGAEEEMGGSYRPGPAQSTLDVV